MGRWRGRIRSRGCSSSGSFTASDFSSARRSSRRSRSASSARGSASSPGYATPSRPVPLYSANERAGVYSVCRGRHNGSSDRALFVWSATDMHLWLREDLGRGGARGGEFATPDRLVQLLARHSRISFLPTLMVAVPAHVGVEATTAGDRARSDVGDHREYTSGHPALSRAGARAGLHRRQHYQFCLRHAHDGRRLRHGVANADVAHRGHRSLLRNLCRIHDSRQSDAQRHQFNTRLSIDSRLAGGSVE